MYPFCERGNGVTFSHAEAVGFQRLPNHGAHNCPSHTVFGAGGIRITGSKERGPQAQARIPI